MHTPQMTQRLETEGAQPAERMTPEQLKAAMAQELAQLEQQVKQLDIKVQ
jgi:tripartite-type tricarboxylate transporter receptor subunit TctC